jgi:hypothetical protein
MLRPQTSGFFLILLAASACSPRTGTPRDPGSPTPAAGPAPGPGTTGTPQAAPGGTGTGGLPDRRNVPVRADQAPLVHVREVLEADSLLGRRVRVVGRCTAAGTGRRAGSWTLEDEGQSVEVRGLVPFSCGSDTEEGLTIFAQIEPAAPGSEDRLLLRLPD